MMSWKIYLWVNGILDGLMLLGGGPIAWLYLTSPISEYGWFALAQGCIRDRQPGYIRPNLPTHSPPVRAGESRRQTAGVATPIGKARLMIRDLG